jgi:hypothetical protein
LERVACSESRVVASRRLTFAVVLLQHGGVHGSGCSAASNNSQAGAESCLQRARRTVDSGTVGGLHTRGAAVEHANNNSRIVKTFAVVSTDIVTHCEHCHYTVLSLLHLPHHITPAQLLHRQRPPPPTSSNANLLHSQPSPQPTFSTANLLHSQPSPPPTITTANLLLLLRLFYISTSFCTTVEELLFLSSGYSCNSRGYPAARRCARQRLFGSI